MTRREAREQAFALVFEKIFQKEESPQELIRQSEENLDIEIDDYAKEAFFRIYEDLDTIDGHIDNFSKNWKRSRISKVSLSVLRISICEILYMDTVPTKVSINEAVELAKKYGGEEDASYINGVLGAFSRALGVENQ